MPKGRQFDFSESQIFSKFDLFCRRVIKLMDMFTTIYQFKCLEESKDKFDGMEILVNKFSSVLASFKAKRHDLLDFHSNKFDRDYVAFNVAVSDLESELQMYINARFENIISIDQSLSEIKRFQEILQRDSLKADLNAKFTVIFHNYGMDVHTVQDMYEKYKHAPPIPRNMPPVAGNIMWSRHLLSRIEEPMEKFQSQEGGNVFSSTR